MRSCPVPNRYWRRLVNKLGNEDIAYNLYFSKGDSVYDMSDEELSRYTTTPKVETQYQKIKNDLEKDDFIETHEKSLRDIAARMAERIGMDYEIIPVDKGRNLNFKGKIENNKAVINAAYATKDTPIHEILGHPIIRTIKNRNNVREDTFDVLPANQVIGYENKEGFVVVNYETFIPFKTLYSTEEEAKKAIPSILNRLKSDNLYKNLLKELEYGRGKEILDRVKKDYVYKSFSQPGGYYTRDDEENPFADSVWIEDEDYTVGTDPYTLEEQQEEALVELLGLMTSDRLDKIKDGKLISVLKKLLKEIKAFIKELLFEHEIEIEKLPDSLTLGDLADILAYSNSKIIVRGYEVEYTTPDNRKFKTYAEASKHISDLAKDVKDVDLSNIDVVKKLTPEELDQIDKLEKEIKQLDELQNSEEYKKEKEFKIQELNNQLVNLINNVKFFSQEPSLNLEDKNKYGFQDYDYVRVESSYSRTVSPFGETLWEQNFGKNFEGYYIHGYNTDKRKPGPDTKVLKITKEEAFNIWKKEYDENPEWSLEASDKQEYFRIKDEISKLKTNAPITLRINNINSEIANILKDPFATFIEENKEYEQNKEIIEEWKRVNNIVYNPEEVYSRGQEFVSVIGAYSNFDLDLLLQNLLFHIEDSEKAGGEFTISAFTKPSDRTIHHLERGSKVKFKIYPQSKDIKWAASGDVYSGSVWNAPELFNKNVDKILTGVSYSKYPNYYGMISYLKPNLADIIENLEHHHNELGISLTGNNFRLEYSDDVPTKTKKLVDSVNSILDQRYGKLIKPELNVENLDYYNKLSNLKADVEYHEIFKDDIPEAKVAYFKALKELEDFKNSKNLKFDVLKYEPYVSEPSIIYTTNSEKDAISFIENQIEIYGNPKDSYKIDVTIKQLGVEPIITDKNIKENIYQVGERISKEDPEKTFISQANINAKITALKQSAKKYPRALIRSEVRRQQNVDSNYLFADGDLPFQKVPSMQPGSYSRYRPSSTISILKQVKFRESIKPGDVTSFTYWSETTSKLVSEKDIVVESVGNDYFEGRYPNGEGRTFKYKNIVDDSIQGTLTTFEQKQFKDRLMLGQTIFVKTNIGDFNGKVTSIEEDSFSVDNQQINYSDVFKEEPQLAFLQNIQDLKETISNQIVVYQSKMKTVDQKKRVESLRRALEMLEGYKEYNDLIGFFAEVRSNIDDTKALLKAVVDPEKKYTPEKILYIISYAKDFLDSYFHLRGLNNSIQNFEGSEELKAISNQLFADLEDTKQEYFNVALPQLRDVLWEQFDMNTNNQLAAAGEKIYTKERLLEELKNPTRDLDAFNKFFVAPINSNDIILGLFSKMLKKGKEAARKINELLIRDLTPMVNSLKKKYDLKELMKNFYTITEETIFEDGKPRIIRVRRFIQKYNQKKYYDETNLMYQERQRAIDDINLAEAAGDATARENALGRYKIINEKLNAYKRLNGVQITASQFKAKMEKLKALNDDDFIKNLDRYYTPTTEAESDENSIVTENELTGEKTYYRYTNKRWEANKEMFITDEYKRLQTLFDRDPEVKRFFDYLMDKYEEANRKIPEAYRLRGVVPSVYETNFLNSIKKGWKNFWRTNEKQLMVRLDGKPYKEIPIGFTKLIDIDESSDDILRSTMLFLAEANNFGEMSRYLGTADTLVEALEAKYPLDSSQKQKMFSSMNNRLDAVKRTIDQTLYGIHKDSYGLGSKVLDLLNKFTSFTRIALKPLNWISNILVGNMGNLSEAVGGRHFGVRDIMWAQKEMFKLMFTNPKKFANMIRSLDAVQGRFLKEFGDEFISFREKYVAWDTMFIGQDMGELQIQGTAMLAYLRARKIPIPADGNFDLDSLPPDFINTLHAINKHNHGVYNNFDRLYLQTNALFRLMLQFRKYIVPTFRARYDGLFSGNNRVDWESGTVEKGWWRIWGEYHYNTIKNWKQMPSFIASFNSLTDAEKEGVRRAYFDAAAYTLLYGLFVMMKPDDDEEEETSKFEWHVLYQLEKLKGDYGLIFPLGGFEDKLRLLSNPFAAAPVAADSLAILSQVTNFEPDKEGNVSIYQRYQRDTGYYKKGDLKILGKVSKINGFDNFIQSEDPKTALQAYLAAARR